MKSLSGFTELTPDKGIMKKIITQGFSKINASDGDQVTLNYKAENEEGTFIEASHYTGKEDYKTILGSHNIIPGLELAIKTMKMGETAVIRITPEYGEIPKEKLTSGEISTNFCHIDYPSSDEIKAMETKDAKKYIVLYYEVELIKFDKLRKSKSQMDTDEKIQEASGLKNEGNELFKEQRFQEAIVKYETGLDYIARIPTNDLSSKVYELRQQLYLNIANCHNNLHQYNYTLKHVEEAFSIKKTPKCFFYRAIALMNLGEFDKAESDIKELDVILPNDITVKKLHDDYLRLKKQTLSKKKNLLKKGLFSSNLYEEKENKTKTSIPPFDKDNTCFYLDLIINEDYKNPKKVKIEILGKKENPVVYESICQLVKDKIVLKDKELNKNDKFIDICAIEDIGIIKNLYPCSEEMLIVLRRSGDCYMLSVCLEAVGDNIVDDYIVVGRCYYNNDIWKGDIQKIKIIDYDFTFNY
jgi:tetratricopeptide (TPR) repeat protein